MLHRLRQFNSRAFTLVEMLVVIALIGMLAAILSVALMTARRMSVRVECQGKLNQIGTLMHQISLQNGGAYPALEVDEDGKPSAGGTPWWAKVYQLAGGTSIDSDASTPGIQITAQLPSQMQMFRCRMGPALDNSEPNALQNLNGTISYGLNFDTKRADGKAYQWNSAAGAFAMDGAEPLGPRVAVPQDEDADSFNYTQVQEPSKFILIAEGNAGEFDSPDADALPDKSGFKVAAQKVSEAGARADDYALVFGRHKKMANVLFLDLHVEAVNADQNQTETLNVNLMTNLWTLPAD